MSTDPNLSHEAVKFYRETFRLCPNFGKRKDIVSTVKDFGLWKAVLNEWKERKWNPLKINWMLSEYEHRERSGDAANGRAGKRDSAEKDLQVGVSQRCGWRLSCMSENAGVRFRASNKTLEEIVTEALRTNNRSQTKVEP